VAEQGSTRLDAQSATLGQWVRYSRIATRTGLGLTAVGIGLVTARPPGPLAFGIAALLGLTGAIIRFWSAGIIAKNEELATGGPYAYVRNPLYLGSLLIAVAFLLLNGNPWFAVPAAVAAVFIYLRTVQAEEEFLAGRFGAAFATYRATVPAILPWKGRCEVPGSGTTYALEQSLKNREYNGFLGTVGMLIAFYVYMHWVDPVPFRVTAGLLVVGALVLRALREARRDSARSAGAAGGERSAADDDAGQSGA
jgi:protein-S-isoprenylcysteine O-methyltransferase Ste14